MVSVPIVFATVNNATNATMATIYNGPREVTADDEFMKKLKRTHGDDMTKAIAQEEACNFCDHVPGFSEGKPGVVAHVDFAYYPGATYAPTRKPTLVAGGNSHLPYDKAADMYNLTGGGGDSNMNSDFGQGRNVMAHMLGDDVTVETHAYNERTKEGNVTLYAKFPYTKDQIGEMGPELREAQLKNHRFVTFPFTVDDDESGAFVNLVDKSSQSSKYREYQNRLAEYISVTPFQGIDKRTGNPEESLTKAAVKTRLLQGVVAMARDPKLHGTSAVVNYTTDIAQVKGAAGSTNERLQAKQVQTEIGTVIDIYDIKSKTMLSDALGKYWQNWNGLLPQRPMPGKPGKKIHWAYNLTIHGTQISRFISRCPKLDAIAACIGAPVDKSDTSKEMHGVTRPKNVPIEVRDEEGKVQCAELVFRMHPSVVATANDKTGRHYNALNHRSQPLSEGYDPVGMGTGLIALSVNRTLNYGEPFSFYDDKALFGSEDGLGPRLEMGTGALMQHKEDAVLCVARTMFKHAGCEYSPTDPTQMTSEGKKLAQKIVGHDRPLDTVMAAMMTSSEKNKCGNTGCQPSGDRRGRFKFCLYDVCATLYAGTLAPTGDKAKYAMPGVGDKSVRSQVVRTLLTAVCRQDPYMKRLLAAANAHVNSTWKSEDEILAAHEAAVDKSKKVMGVAKKLHERLIELQEEKDEEAEAAAEVEAKKVRLAQEKEKARAARLELAPTAIRTLTREKLASLPGGVNAVDGLQDTLGKYEEAASANADNAWHVVKKPTAATHANVMSRWEPIAFMQALAFKAQAHAAAEDAQMPGAPPRGETFGYTAQEADQALHMAFNVLKRTAHSENYGGIALAEEYTGLAAPESDEVIDYIYKTTGQFPHKRQKTTAADESPREEGNDE